MANLRTCLVSFSDHSGIRHTAEVSAESLYEAAILGIKAISQQWGESPGAMTPIEVRVAAPAVKHELRPIQILQWLNASSQSPKEKLMKERLKDLFL